MKEKRGAQAPLAASRKGFQLPTFAGFTQGDRPKRRCIVLFSQTLNHAPDTAVMPHIFTVQGT